MRKFLETGEPVKEKKGGDYKSYCNLASHLSIDLITDCMECNAMRIRHT